MTPDQVRELEAAGYRVGTVSEFLELTPEQAARVEDAAAKLTAELNEVAKGIGTKPSRTRATRTKVAVPQ